ncbi:MAG: hypothetical protein WCK28_00185 [Burkholderiales bacterium]|jgi:hypothetical protein
MTLAEQIAYMERRREVLACRAEQHAAEANERVALAQTDPALAGRKARRKADRVRAEIRCVDAILGTLQSIEARGA